MPGILSPAFFMSAQIKYYNQFGNAYRQSILSCPEPELWTTDYTEKGRVYNEMKSRIEQQQLIDDYFLFSGRCWIWVVALAGRQ